MKYTSLRRSMWISQSQSRLPRANFPPRRSLASRETDIVTRRIKWWNTPELHTAHPLDYMSHLQSLLTFCNEMRLFFFFFADVTTSFLFGKPWDFGFSDPDVLYLLLSVAIRPYLLQIWSPRIMGNGKIMGNRKINIDLKMVEVRNLTVSQNGRYPQNKIQSHYIPEQL